jgi:tripartite-type tricarboxylate transporter receptor subunit TctC
MGYLRTALGLLAALLASAAAAQYPAKPIRMIAPFPPGGALDVVGRIIAPPLSQALGQPVVVENRPGADGAIALDLVAKSPPDGYTLILASYTNLSALPNIRQNLPFDAMSDFMPVSAVGKLTFFIVVHPGIPARTLKEFIEYARAHTGQLNYGSANATSMMGPALLMSFGGFEMQGIQYKGEALALNDFLSGRLQLMFISGTLVPHVKDGKLRALATILDTRSPLLPEVPTMVEAGVPDFEITSWFGLLAPAGTPAPVIARLNAEMVKVLARDDVRSTLGAQGLNVRSSTPEEFAAHIRSEIARFTKIARTAGIKAE